MCSADGRFAIVNLELGVTDLIITAPELQYENLPTLALKPGVIELGDIAVRPGFAIQGHVADPTGKPIIDAVVTLTNHQYGARHASSDRYGHYGLVDGSPTEIQATTSDRRRSLPVKVPMHDAVLDLVVVPTGNVTGSVVGALERVERVVMRPVDGPDATLHAELDASSRFRFDDVPIGEYDVQLVLATRRLSTRQRITVTVRGQSLTLSSPAVPVTIQVHVTGRPCTSVELHPTDASLGHQTQRCVRGEAEIRRVMPGRYRVCADGTCEPIEVMVSHTWFELEVPP